MTGRKSGLLYWVTNLGSGHVGLLIWVLGTITSIYLAKLDVSGCSAGVAMCGGGTITCCSEEGGGV